jgi:Tol biopolymer transport system component
MKRSIVLVATLSVLVMMIASPADASFPGSNGKIAFASFSRHGTFSIGAVEPNGSGLTSLSDHFQDSYPSWSADGTTIVFAHYHRGEPDKIVTMASDGTGRSVVFAASAYMQFIARPVWSPDGSKIAFEARVGTHYSPKIYTINANGSLLTNISGHDNNDSDPDWSPDGTKIAFASRDGVMTMNTDGSERSLVVDNGFWPSWSPDGTMLAFRSHNDIYVSATDGSSLTQLTDAPRFESYPAFSPDGTLVAFVRRMPSHGEVWTVALADLTTTRITDTKRDEYALSWQALSP